VRDTLRQFPIFGETLENQNRLTFSIYVISALLVSINLLMKGQSMIDVISGCTLGYKERVKSRLNLGYVWSPGKIDILLGICVLDNGFKEMKCRFGIGFCQSVIAGHGCKGVLEAGN
jgi:hypothetical protein